MSLINQMLQELDARGTPAPGSTGILQGHIRAVPERGGRHPAWLAAVGLGVAACAASAWFWWTPAPNQSAASPALAVSVGGTAAPASAAQVESRANQVSDPPSSAPDSAPAPISETEISLKLAAGLQRLPAVISPALQESGKAKQEQMAAHVSGPGAEPRALVATPSTSRVVPDTAQGAVAPTVQSGTVQPAQEQANPVLLAKEIKPLTPQQHAENEFRKGATLIQQGRSGEAAAVLEQALQMDAGHAVARQTLVAILIENKRFDEAIRRLRDGLQIDPAQSGAAMILARLQIERGEAKAAIDTLQRHLPHGGERADYRAFFAALLQREGRHREAIDHYGVALRQSPQNGVWWMGLGISLQSDHRYADASDAYHRAKMSGSLTPELKAFVEEKISNLPR